MSEVIPSAKREITPRKAVSSGLEFNMVREILRAQVPADAHQALASHARKHLACHQSYVIHKTSDHIKLSAISGNPQPDLSPTFMNGTHLTTAASRSPAMLTGTLNTTATSYSAVTVSLDLPRNSGTILLITVRFAPNEAFTRQEAQKLQQLLDTAAPALKNIWEITTLRRELARQERQVSDAKAATRARAAFMARMNHDLRTPLSSILGFGQLLEMSELNATQQEYVEHIQTSGQLLLTRIDEVLDLSLAESGKLTLMIQPVNVGTTLADVIGTMSLDAADKGLQFRFQNSQPELRKSLAVLADPQRFRQVLLNLLSNAIEHAPRHSLITIRTTVVEEDAVEFQVSDSGPGISSQQLPQLFRSPAYFSINMRTDEPSGFGLPLTKLLLEAMGGTIRVESTVGEGSTFIIKLPRYKPRE